MEQTEGEPTQDVGGTPDSPGTSSQDLEQQTYDKGQPEADPGEIHAGMNAPELPGTEVEDTGGYGEVELAVLAPEHPLMKRFQSALKEHLSKQLEKVNLEIRDNLAEERTENMEREQVALEVYSLQRDLARLQLALGAQHDINQQTGNRRAQVQEQLESIRVQYRSILEETSQQRVQDSKLQTEMENMARQLTYTQQAKEEMQTNLVAMKNTSSKAHTERMQAEEQKYKQDLYVERLTKQIEKLNGEIALNTVQTKAQSEETKAAREALAEAQMEMDTLVVERKQLLQHWNTTLQGMGRRDEAYAAMQEVLREAQEHIQTLDMEVSGFKRSIRKEEDRNELLTSMLNRSEVHCSNSRREIERIRTQHEALQAKYNTYTRTLHETEQAMSYVNEESGLLQSDLATLERQLQTELFFRIETEDKIIERMREQVTHDQVARHCIRLAEKANAQKRELEVQLSKLENDLAQATLQATETVLQLDSLQRVLTELEQNVAQSDKDIASTEVEINKNNAIIKRNQIAVNSYNKKIQTIIAKTGHAELGPLQLRIKNLTQDLDNVAAEMKELQQSWLWQQEELVKLNTERQLQSAAVLSLQSKFTILQQRKIRRDGEVQQEQREKAELDKHMKGLQDDTMKLNTLLSKNTELQEALEQGTAAMESGFIHSLKDAEMESVGMQMKLEKIGEEKERLLNSLVEAELQVMLWEKKIQLLKEMRSAVNSEEEQREIRSMKAEIRRMEMRYAQMLKQQERMLQDMEAAVGRRETIVVRNETRAKADKKQPTQTDFQNMLSNLRRKVQDLQKHVQEYQEIIINNQNEHERLSTRISEKQEQVNILLSISRDLTSDIRMYQDTKDKNLPRLVSQQRRARQLVAAREGRYNSANLSGKALEQALQRQEEKLHSLSTVLHRICQDSPEYQSCLRHATLALAHIVETQQSA